MSDNRGPNYMPTSERIRRMCQLIRRTRQFRQRQQEEREVNYGTPVKMCGIRDELDDNRMFAFNLPVNEDN